MHQSRIPLGMTSAPAARNAAAQRTGGSGPGLVCYLWVWYSCERRLCYVMAASALHCPWSHPFAQCMATTACVSA